MDLTLQSYNITRDGADELDVAKIEQGIALMDQASAAWERATALVPSA